MENELSRIRNWASHGTIRQFFTEVSAKLSKKPYTAELKGDRVVFYQVSKMGGLLGLGVKTSRKPVLEVIWEGSQIKIPEESADAEFVKMLAGLLGQH